MTETIELNATAPAVKRDTSTVPHEPPRPVKLFDQVRDRIRVLHYSRSTEKTYLYWIKFFILHNHKRHPKDMGAAEVEAFLSHLATQREVSAGTQNQAMHAILFLYKQVLGIDLPWLDGITRAKPSQRLPVVLTQAETQRLLAATRGTSDLVVRLLYGTGLRLMEGLRLRVKDVDFARHQITVRGGKGDKDRITMLPASIEADLRAHLAWIWPDEAKAGKPIAVPLNDDALAVLRDRHGSDPRHVFTWRGRTIFHTTTKAWVKALDRAGIEKGFTFHDLRHTWASWHVMAGTPLEVLRQLGGWADMTMVLRYAHLSPGYVAGYAENVSLTISTTQQEKVSDDYRGNSRDLGWLMGLEPTTTGITILRRGKKSA